MSVVNRMLQDIDRRNSNEEDKRLAHPEIHSVASRRQNSSRTKMLVWAAVLLFGTCVAAAIVWRGWASVEVQTAVPLPPVMSQSSASWTVPIETATTPIAPVVEHTTHPFAPPVEPAIVLPGQIEKPFANLPSAKFSAVLAPPEMLKLSTQLSDLVAEVPANRASIKSTPIVPALPLGTTTITNIPVRQVAAEETVFAARTMWNEGSQAAALATLRDALTLAESLRNQRAIISLARELARLEVAGSRAQPALDLLKRLENIFGADADAWALRGNAEQRLGQHSEATESYLAALRLRPNEGKWMLGAAISLAASGKLDAAQIWVEKARERDAVTPSIAAYLQQLGILPRQ